MLSRSADLSTCQNGTSGLKSRYIFRIKLGDECTNFFLAMATVSYSKNNITHLKDDNGIVVIDYDGKAALL